MPRRLLTAPPNTLPLFALAFVAFFAGLAQAEDETAKKHFYEPVEKNIEGWTVAVDPQLLEGEGAEEGEKTLVALANHLQRITYILDDERVAELQKRRIWIERCSRE
jgi:hypothetical protein